MRSSPPCISSHCAGPPRLDQAGLRLHARPLCLVRRPSAEDKGARELDVRLQPASLSLAAGLLQPAVLPHCDHAEHRQEERAAAGQDVPHVRGDQEDQGGDDPASEGGGLHTRALHGGRQVGRADKLHCQLQAEGPPPHDARHLDKGCHYGKNYDGLDVTGFTLLIHLM